MSRGPPPSPRRSSCCVLVTRPRVRQSRMGRCIHRKGHGSSRPRAGRTPWPGSGRVRVGPGAVEDGEHAQLPPPHHPCVATSGCWGVAGDEVRGGVCGSSWAVHSGASTAVRLGGAAAVQVPPCRSRHHRFHAPRRAGLRRSTACRCPGAGRLRVRSSSTRGGRWRRADGGTVGPCAVDRRVRRRGRCGSDAYRAGGGPRRSAHGRAATAGRCGRPVRPGRPCTGCAALERGSGPAQPADGDLHPPG